NVRVVVTEGIPDQLIIPKTAVVQRQGKQVVFCWRNDTALWHYVKVGAENEDRFTITEGLSETDIVITSGNLNLAHQSQVQIP
ncbi:MAG: efflux RND transporter periplasmic adaptor subunit, partial [Bacteroidota bacterium]